MARLPGVIMPVPFENVAVRVVDAPGAIDEGLAVKLVIEGASAEFTATVTIFCSGAPDKSVTVSV
jgi:hypothetical protein